jgi:hypothetical protein
MLRMKYKKGEKKLHQSHRMELTFHNPFCLWICMNSNFHVQPVKFWFCPIFYCHFTFVWFSRWLTTVPKVQTKTVAPDTLKHTVLFHTNIIFLDTTCQYPAQWYHLAQNLLILQITELWFLFHIFQVTLGNLVAAHGSWPWNILSSVTTLTWYERVKCNLCHEHAEGLKWITKSYDTNPFWYNC